MLRVAVADDEPIMQMYLEQVLEDMGYDVVAVAGDGAELVDLCRRQSPDLVVTDIKMPGMDGVQAAQEICRDCPLPILFVTGYADRQNNLPESNCIQLCLVKPVGEAELQAGIAETLRRYAQFQTLIQQAPTVKQALADRRRVEEAKSRLMILRSMTDDDAFQALRDEAARDGITIAQAADRLLTVQ